MLSRTKKIEILFDLALLSGFIFLYFFLYKERVLYVDSAAQLFRMINGEEPVIFAKRYTMIINQVLPLLGIKAGLNLATVIFLYNASFVAIAIGIFFLLKNGLKTPGLPYIIFFPLFFIRHAFFHAISEGVLLIGYSALLMGFLMIKNLKNTRIFYFWSLLIILFLLNIFIHPLSIFTVFFVLGYAAITKKQPWLHVLIQAVIFIGLYMAAHRLFPSGHNESFTRNLRDTGEILGNWRENVAIQYFMQLGWKRLFPFFVLFISLVLLLVKKKNWVELLFITGFLFLYVGACFIIFHKGDSELGMESRYVFLFFFAGIPFLIKMPENYTRIVTLVLFMAGAYFIIRTSYYIFQPRYAYIRETLQTMDEEGIAYGLAQIEDYPKEVMLVTWGVSVESMMIARLESFQTARTFFMLTPSTPALDEEMMKTSILLFPWWMYFHQEQINPAYFPGVGEIHYIPVHHNTGS